MTLPAGVLYKSHTSRPPKNAPSFAQNGQDLTWSGINLAKRGAAHTIKLKVNVTNCADGQLAFAAATTVGGVCPTTATPKTATVKHGKGWTACPPSELCSIPTADPGVFVCHEGVSMCGNRDASPSASTPLLCGQACLQGGYDFATFFPFAGGDCGCFYTASVTGRYNDVYTGLALGQPRTPVDVGCIRRRL